MSLAKSKSAHAFREIQVQGIPRAAWPASGEDELRLEFKPKKHDVPINLE